MLPTSNVNINWVPGLTLDEMEKHCILQAFRFYRGNKTQTSHALGIAIRTLDNKLEKYEHDNNRLIEQGEADRINRDNILARMRGLPQPAAGSIPQKLTAQTNGDETTSGQRLESAQDLPAQQTMSVPERKEVQDVLSRKASTGRHQRAR